MDLFRSLITCFTDKKNKINMNALHKHREIMIKEYICYQKYLIYGQILNKHIALTTKGIKLNHDLSN